MIFFRHKILDTRSKIWGIQNYEFRINNVGFPHLTTMTTRSRQQKKTQEARHKNQDLVNSEL
jgi:hypothetical protein